MGLQLYKQPLPSSELQLLRYLRRRMLLSNDFSRAYDNATKGYLGERKFYQILKQRLSSDCIILFDLLLTANGTTFQIDCLLIFPETVYLIEVKNYEGDFYLKNDKWFSGATKSEIRNPLLQLERSHYLLERLMRDFRMDAPVRSYVVFVHDEFFLYNAPMKLPVIYRPQLRRFIQSLNNSRSRTRLGQRHVKFAKILLDRHMDESRFVRLPEYEFDSMRKGLVCFRCDGGMKLIGYKRSVCSHCGSAEGINSVVMRHVVEYSLLFPDEKVTVSRIFEWSGGELPRNSVRRILKKYMKLVSKSQLTYYQFD